MCYGVFTTGVLKDSDEKAAGYLSALTTPPHIFVYLPSRLHSALSRKDYTLTLQSPQV